MNWYLQNGKESDVIINSQVKLLRNIEGIPFTTKASKDNLKNVYEQMQEITPTLGYGLQFKNLKDMKLQEKIILQEKNIIDSEFAKSNNPYNAIIINEDENICILINEEDHIKLELFSSGLELENLLNLAIEIDQKLETKVKYSYHEKYGYLTTCPTNVGTGLKATATVYLPALSITGNLRKVINIVNNLGMNIRGMYGEGNKIEGDIYQISNNQTLGVTEKEIIKNLNLICQKLIEQERVARQYLTKNPTDLEDKIYRAYGILTNARKIDEEETIELLSNVKLGVDLGIIKEINDQKVLELYLYTKPANMKKRIGISEDISELEQETQRANIVKEIIKQNS